MRRSRQLICRESLACSLSVDYGREMAFVALDEGTGRMLGLVRLEDEPDEERRHEDIGSQFKRVVLDLANEACARI